MRWIPSHDRMTLMAAGPVQVPARLNRPSEGRPCSGFLYLLGLALAVLTTGCGTGSAYLELSAKQKEALRVHRSHDAVLYQTVKDLSRQASGGSVSRTQSELRLAHAHAYGQVFQDLDKVVQAQFEAGSSELDKIAGPRIAAAEKNLNEKTRAVDLASSERKIQTQLELEHAKAEYADLNAVLFDSKLSLLTGIQQKRDESLQKAKAALDEQLAKTLASIASSNTAMAADLFTSLDRELDALDAIAGAHQVLDDYLNRPSALALFIHGGLSEAGLHVSVEKIDGIFKGPEDKMRAAFYSLGDSSAEGTRAALISATFQELGRNLTNTAKKELAVFSRDVLDKFIAGRLK